MSNQLQITGGAKVRNLEGVLTGTSGVVNALGINVPSGIPQLDGSGTLGYTVFNGTANLTSLSLTGPVEGPSTYSVSLQGTGAYTISGTQVEPGGVVVIGSNVVMFDYTAAGGETSITWAGAIGMSCVTVTRGGVEVRSIGVSGTPTGENVVFNSSTGTLTFASGRALESDEFVRAIFK